VILQYTRQTLSYQLSDHFPVWMQVNVDVENQRLEQIIQEGEKRRACMP